MGQPIHDDIDEHEDALARVQRTPLAVAYGRHADGHMVTIVVCSDGTVFEHTATFAGTEEDSGPIVRVDAWRALPPIPGTAAELLGRARREAEEYAARAPRFFVSDSRADADPDEPHALPRGATPRSEPLGGLSPEIEQWLKMQDDARRAG